HAYHHNTNGDWVKYGGVFNIVSTDKFAQLPEKKQKQYWLFRQPLILIPAGFVYVLFNPRFNWLRGRWKTKQDGLHMTYNNLVLLAIWAVMCKVMGAGDFFLLYATSTSLAG